MGDGGTPPERRVLCIGTFQIRFISTRQDSWGGRTFLTHFIWMASISEGIGATEVLVPYFCQARDGGYEYGSYSQYRAHLAIFQPIWRKG